MPYITEDKRAYCNPFEYSFCGDGKSPATAGEYNFAITKLIDEYLGPNPNYDKFNSAIGVLECAKLELYRRMVAPYEDTKIEENGDVY